MQGSREKLEERQKKAKKAYTVILEVLYVAYWKGLRLFPSDERKIVDFVGQKLMKYGSKISSMEVFSARNWELEPGPKAYFLGGALFRLERAGVLVERFGHYILVPRRLREECLINGRDLTIPIEVLEEVADAFIAEATYYYSPVLDRAPSGALTFL